MNIDFPLFLLCATVLTGAVALVDWLFLGPRRRRALQITQTLTDTLVNKKGISYTVERRPFIAAECRSLFPIFLFVLLLRSFLFQPFRVPTGSLEPTVMPGDFILVTMYNYGLRLPVWHTKIYPGHAPKTGDITLFRWPVNPKVDFVKRVVGVPGDHISYINKVFYINGKIQPQTFVGYATDHDESGARSWPVKVMSENLAGVKHQIYINSAVPVHNFYNVVIPKGHYFMIGDNRDNSDDSRFWGVVPDAAIIGQARYTFLNVVFSPFSVNWHRVGNKL